MGFAVCASYEFDVASNRSRGMCGCDSGSGDDCDNYQSLVRVSCGVIASKCTDASVF